MSPFSSKKELPAHNKQQKGNMQMATVVIMPRQGQSVESCIITAFNKKLGDTVEVGDILFSYETDKSSFDEPAPEAGKILGVEVLDHIIVGDSYSSLKEKGYL